MIKCLARCGLAAAVLASGGCPEQATAPSHTAFVQHWNFDMGSQGGGAVRFHASGGESGPQDGECLVAVCHTRVEQKTTLTLTPSASPGFRFSRWVGDPARNLPCDGGFGIADDTVVSVVRDGACFAVFEPAGGGPTTPGAR